MPEKEHSYQISSLTVEELRDSLNANRYLAALVADEKKLVCRVRLISRRLVFLGLAHIGWVFLGSTLKDEVDG